MGGAGNSGLVSKYDHQTIPESPIIDSITLIDKTLSLVYLVMGVVILVLQMSPKPVTPSLHKVIMVGSGGVGE